jgi:hypothetical protein
MFRKLHSNRDPRDTLFSELNKEFRPYIHKAGKGLKGLADDHPKFLFVMMVINIVLSVILSFTVFRRHDQPPKVVKSIVNPVTGGFDQIMRTGEKLKPDSKKAIVRCRQPGPGAGTGHHSKT